MVRRSLLTMRPAARIGGGVMSNSRLDQSTTPSKPTPESILADAREQRQEVVAVYTEEHARRLEADLNELREMRKERAGGKVFKRKCSSKWQLRYLVGDRWVDESSGKTDKREAQRWLAWKVYQASTGALPGTAKIEQAIELLLNDASVRGLRSVKRLERAKRPLLARLSGMRAKDVSHSVLVKYAANRKIDGRRPDSIKFELEMLRKSIEARAARGLDNQPAGVPAHRTLTRAIGFFRRARVGASARAFAAGLSRCC
jgi:hypothetical protein